MNEIAEAIGMFCLTAFMLIVGFLSGALYYWSYVGKNSVCSDRACIYLHDKNKIIEYDKL